MKTKKNLDRIQKSLRVWGTQPMYTRHDNLTTTLMMPEDFEAMIVKRQNQCLVSKQLIDEMMEENFRLFFNLKVKSSDVNLRKNDNEMIMITDNASGSEIDRPSEVNVGEQEKSVQASESRITLKSIKTSSIAKVTDIKQESSESYEIIKTQDQIELFTPYEKHIDDLIWSEVHDALFLSIKYIKYEMENRLEHNSPIFEAKLELIDDIIQFTPEMDINYTNPIGLMEIIQSMIANILNMSQMLPLIAQTDDGIIETFTVFLEPINGQTPKDVEDIFEMQKDILELTRDGIKAAIAFAKKFDKFKFLWKDDKTIQLEAFLKYGKLLSSEELAKIEEGEVNLDIEEHSPSLEKFREVIDFYVQVYDDIDKYETAEIFKNWLRIDLKKLKHSLMNEVRKWSHLFKQYLQDKVINDLKELEEFIHDSTMKLNQQATNEDAPTLLSILKTIAQINERSEQTDKMFEPLRQIVDVLKSYDVEFEEFVDDHFAQLPESWITLKKLSLIVKRNIAPVQAYQVDLIKKRINLFDIRTKLYYENFIRCGIFKYPCDDVYGICDRIHNELIMMEQLCNGLKEQSVHFNLNPPEEGRMSYCRKTTRFLKHIWDYHFAVLSCIDDWKQTAWKKIDSDDMETELKRFLKEMRGFDKESKNFVPFIETNSMVNNLLASIKAIKDLQNTSIRERHWIELMHTTQVRKINLNLIFHLDVIKSILIIQNFHPSLNIHKSFCHLNSFSS